MYQSFTHHHKLQINSQQRIPCTFLHPQRLSGLPLLKLLGSPDKNVSAAGVPVSQPAPLHSETNQQQQKQQKQKQPSRLFFPLSLNGPTTSGSPKGSLRALLSQAGGFLAPEQLPLPQLDPSLLQHWQQEQQQQQQQLTGRETSPQEAQLVWQALQKMGVLEMRDLDVLEFCVLPLFDRHREQSGQAKQQQQQQRQQQEEEDEKLIAALRFVALSGLLADKVCAAC